MNKKNSENKSDMDSQEELSGDLVNMLQNAFKFFNETTQRLEESYRRLEQKVQLLNDELEKKNVELISSLKEADSIRNHLKNILECMDVGVVVVDLSGSISIFNNAASKMTGYAADEVVGKPYRKVIGKGVDEKKTPIYTLYQSVEMTNVEKEITSASGEKFPVEFSCTLIKSNLGEVLGVVEVFEDMTEIRRLEKEVQQKRTLAVLGEMAAHVAHEIRNPLGGIGGFAALLERDLDINDPRRKMVKKIIEGVGSLNRIAANLLFFTRPVRPHIRPENLTQVTDEVISLVEVELDQEPKEISLIREFDEEEISVDIDPELIHQVLLNILKNGAQAIEDKGELRVGIVRDSQKNQVILSVKDNGSGMSEEVRQKVFNPFFSTKTDGTGLGLAIVKKIIDMHNGTLEFDSEEGVGTEFRIIFPVK